MASSTFIPHTGYLATRRPPIFLGNAGMYLGAVEQMEKWHMFFSLSPVGIVAGTVEAAVVSFVFCYVFALLYNGLGGSAAA